MAALSKVEGIPLYVKIRESLREDIRSGIYQAGQRIPSEDELAAQHGVSRMTARQGISDLIDEGILYRRHGVGTFVTQVHIDRDHTHLSNFFEGAREKGIDPSTVILKAEIVPARLKVAKALALQEGEPVNHIVTLRQANGEPVTVHDAFVPYKLFPTLTTWDLNGRHLWELIETFGFRVKRADQRLEAREADDWLAGLLEIDAGAPILFKERIIYADDGTPVEFTYCFNRGDRYSLTVTLYR